MSVKRKEKWESEGQGILAQSRCCQCLGWMCWKGSESWMMSMKCVAQGWGMGSFPSRAPGCWQDHSCVLPLLPYTSIPETLAQQQSGAMAVSAWGITQVFVFYCCTKEKLSLHFAFLNTSGSLLRPVQVRANSKSQSRADRNYWNVIRT